MIELTPNRLPPGQSCGTCRFAGTHTIAEERADQIVVKCRRFPPLVIDYVAQHKELRHRPPEARFPYTLWDDWCGEWEERDPDPEDKPEPMGFRP